MLGKPVPELASGFELVRALFMMALVPQELPQPVVAGGVLGLDLQGCPVGVGGRLRLLELDE